MRAEARLRYDSLWVRIGLQTARRMRAFMVRMETEPEAVQAETTAWLSQVDQRLKEFGREQGRKPRKHELGLILFGPE
jgi:hypothetical protein